MSEDKNVYIVKFTDPKLKIKTKVIYDADNIDECTRIFRASEGEKSVIKKITKMTESDYKHMIL